VRSLPGILGVVVLFAAVAAAVWLSLRPTGGPPTRPGEGTAPTPGPRDPVPEEPGVGGDVVPPVVRDARVPPPEDLPLRTIEVLIAESETDRAVRALAPWLVREPENPRIYRLRGRAWLDGQSWRRADADFARALELEGDAVTATSLDGRAEALIHLRKTADARKLLERSLALSPDRARPHSLLALGYLGEGDEKAARTEIETALTLDPAEPLAIGLSKRLDTSRR